MTLITVLLFVAFRPSSLTETPNPDDLITPNQYLPSLSYNAGLEVLGALPTSVALGVFGLNNIDKPGGITLTNVIANEFNMVTVSPFFSSIRACPPRWMIDEDYPSGEVEEGGNPYYNEKILQDILAQNTYPCAGALADALDDPGNWDDYEAVDNPDYSSIDTVVAWAKREQLEGNPTYVHMNPILWDFDGSSIQPSWLQGTRMMPGSPRYVVYLDHNNWTRQERLSVLRLMDEHITGLVQRYCTASIFNNQYAATPSPTPTVTPHPWNQTSLQGVVAVWEVLNEVTNGNGTVRDLRTDVYNFGYGWAIVNELVNENSPYYDEELADEYDPNDTRSYQDFYVYQAFKYADEAVDDYCGGDGNIVPKLSLNAHFRVDFPIDQGEPHHNIWAQGTLNLINEVNRNSPLNDPLVDGVGIQSHLTVYTTSPSTITPIPSPTQTSVPAGTPQPPTPPPYNNQGHPFGLRSIIEAFDAVGLEVRITELDVGIQAKLIVTPTAGGSPVSLAPFYYDQQASYYRSVVHQCLYDDTGQFVPICDEISVWLLYDQQQINWRPCEFATLFRPRDIHPTCLIATPTFTHTPSPTITPTGTHPPTLTPSIVPSNTPNLTPSVTPPGAIFPKPAHIASYVELQYAPTPYPSSPTPTGTWTPTSGYPAPLVPTPYPTIKAYP